MEINDERFVKLERKQKHLARTCLGIAIIAFATMILAFIANKQASDARDDLLTTRAETAAKLARVASGVTAQNTVRIYESAVREHNDCVKTVQTSLNNRGQHEAVVAAQDTERAAFLVAFPNGSEFINASFDDMRKNLLDGPLLSSEPRKLEECPPLPKPLDPEIVVLANSIVDEAQDALVEATEETDG